MKENRILRVLLIRPFLFLFLAEVFSQIAMNMVNFILIIVVFELAKSNTAVSGLVLSFTIPAIFFGVLAGVYVDRWDKKRVLFMTNFIRACLLILLAVFHSNLLIVYVLSFIIAITTQFFIPAETPMIPLLVKKQYLLSANALFGLGIFGSILVAYALSGPSLIFFGRGNVFFVESLLFLIAAFCVLFVQPAKRKNPHTWQKTPSVTIASEIRKVFNIMVKTKEVYHSLFLLTLSQLLILVLAVIGPGYASQILNIQVDELPLLFVTPAAIGTIIGAVLLGNYLHTFSKRTMANIGVILSGVGVLLLPYGSKVASKHFVTVINEYMPHILSINILHIMVVLAFILGVANALVFVPSNAILQEKTSGELRGKIYGVLNTLVGISSLIPVIMVGSLADIFGVSSVISGIGILLILLGLYRMAFR